MKTKLTALSSLLILPLLLFSACGEIDDAPSIDAPADMPMRVLSFNIRFDNPNDGPDAWPHRKDFVTDLIRFHKIDLVGTQEGLVHQLEEMEEMMPSFSWVGVGRDDGERGGEFSAIFYDTTRFALIEDDTFWLSDTPDVPGSIGWDAAITRVATWARFTDLENNRRFFVINTHFDHVGQEARVNSAKLMIEKVTELADGGPVIVMGDLNVTDQNEAYTIFADPNSRESALELFDGFYHSKHGHYGPTSTWNAFREIYPDRRIDFIFTDRHFAFLEHGVLADIRDGHFPSDHLPVLAEIIFTE